MEKKSQDGFSLSLSLSLSLEEEEEEEEEEGNIQKVGEGVRMKGIKVLDEKEDFLRRNEEENYKCKKCDTEEECNCRLIIRNTSKQISINNNKLDEIVGGENIPKEKEMIIIKGGDFIMTVFRVQNKECAFRQSLANRLSFVNLTDDNGKTVVGILEKFDKATNSYSIQDFSLFNSNDYAQIKLGDKKFEVSYPFVPTNDTYYKEARSVYYTDSLKGLRVNIYNPDDPFFYDFCYPFVHDGRDVLIQDRRKDFFQQNSLCPVGCDSFKVDFSTKRVICECESDSDKLDFSDKKLLSGLKKQKLENNAIVVRCYNLVFNFLYMKVNVGTWIFFVFIFAAFFFPLIFYRRELKSLPSKLPNEDEDKNEKEKENEGETEAEGEDEGEDDDEDEAEPEENEDEVSSKCSTKASQCLPNPPAYKPSHSSIKPIAKKKPKKLTLKGVSEISIVNKKSKQCHTNFNYLKYLNHLSFDEAVFYDKRFFLQMFIDIAKEKILSSKFSVDIVSFKMLVLVLNVCLCFGFNGLLFNEEYISRMYHGDGDDLFIKTQLPRALYSSVLSFIFYLITQYHFSLKSYFTQLISAKEKEESLQIMSKIKKRLIVFTAIIISLMIALWYYVTAFCAVYLATQNVFLLSSGISVLFLFIFIGIFSFFLAFLKVTSIRVKSQALFYFTSWFL